jgi:NADPH:quinone reductase-like Zn-dependent oxidoreductase
MFRALVLHKDEAGFRAGIESLDDSRLPPLAEGDVRVAVEYSTLNYKDGLALTNKGPVVRAWPMVPGIDGAGTVLESRHARWHVGDAVRAGRRRPGAAALGIYRAAGDGRRHRGLHRDAQRAGARAPWPQGR